MQKWVFAILAGVLVSGCNASLEQYVGKDDSPLRQTPSTNASWPAMKISPGHGITAGTSVGAVVTVTPTNRLLAGSTIGARVSIQRQRMQ